MKYARALLCLFCIALFACGCNGATFNEDDFLGKTSAQIQSEYGPFDCVNNDADADGLYRGTSCGYTIREPRKGFLGTEPEVLFFIVFDQNGFASRCYEGYRPGG